jgi:hypothetical protein
LPAHIQLKVADVAIANLEGALMAGELAGLNRELAVSDLDLVVVDCEIAVPSRNLAVSAVAANGATQQGAGDRRVGALCAPRR